MAGTISVPKSIQRMSTVDKGSGIWIIINIMNGRISGIFDAIV